MGGKCQFFITVIKARFTFNTTHFYLDFITQRNFAAQSLATSPVNIENAISRAFFK